jgi:hypothetical protein
MRSLLPQLLERTQVAGQGFPQRIAAADQHLPEFHNRLFPFIHRLCTFAVRTSLLHP